jgi:hypothetical protein
MIKNEVCKWEICKSHDETNIKINLDSSKARVYKDESFIYQNPKKKKKNTLFFHPGDSSPVCKPIICKYFLS